LQHYTKPLLRAPGSHITSFLILHEITALVPLIALVHYSNWLPEQVVNGKWVQAGVEKWGRYFQRKGWVESEDVSKPTSTCESEMKEHGLNLKEVKSRGAGWNVVVEVATAWAVVKALLPVRILGSVWMTPWFARIAVIPMIRIFQRAGNKVV